MKFDHLHRFTEAGLRCFEQAFVGQLSEDKIELSNAHMTSQVLETGPFIVDDFPTAKAMAQAVLDAIRPLNVYDLLPDVGLWAWLTFAMRDLLFAKDASGRRLVKELHRWMPSNPNDWQKGQRHLVRMPVLLRASFGDIADHLLCGHPSILPEIREQLTSQQDMFNVSFQRAARSLYFDDQRQTLKRGAGNKTAGTPRRLAKVRKQLDVTWELDELEPDRVLDLLPGEFDKFRPKVA